jgi:hypothetical protein
MQRATDVPSAIVEALIPLRRRQSRQPPSFHV